MCECRSLKNEQMIDLSLLLFSQEWLLKVRVLVETSGPRETVRILLQRYPLANLSVSTTVDRWVYILSDQKISSSIMLATQKRSSSGFQQI